MVVVAVRGPMVVVAVRGPMVALAVVLVVAFSAAFVVTLGRAVGLRVERRMRLIPGKENLSFRIAVNQSFHLDTLKLA